MKKKAKFLLKTLVLFFVLIQTGAAYSQKVITIDVNESINPATEEFISQAITAGEKSNSECVLINLNTPGGLLTSTRNIVTRIFDAKVPVVVYVSPSGARAGSAGVFITMAANIAAMAPGTNIGAAHPVSSRGGGDAVLNEKIVNDAAAFIRSIAEKRGRNAMWAEDAVRMSVSIPETEAIAENVVNLIADNVKDLMKKIDGLTVETSEGEVTLHTANAEFENIEMGFFQKVLSRISDPNIAYILMMLGFLGLVFELFNPGAILPGIIGVICLILAFYTMSSLPVNYAAIALIIFGIVLYLLEIKVVSHGMLAIGGTVSVILGSMFLFRTSSTGDVANLSWTVIITTSLVTLLFFLFIVGMGLRAQRMRPSVGEMVQKTGVALSNIGETGTVRIQGVTWNAVSTGGVIRKGSEIMVTGQKGLTLQVSAFDEANKNQQS
ncbi:MAG: nodulation protein NfeD [Chitinophagaceae bacterium]|nr:nodulation protein NfeD [Chitinophagaceae bacterium]